MRALVTGFGPFPTMPRNPSAALAEAIAASPRLRLLGIDATCRILTTAYATLPGELDPLLAEQPDIVLLIGVAGRSPKVRVERRATSRRSLLFPDVAGETAERPTEGAPSGRPVRTPPVRRTRANVVRALAMLRRNGLPARHSRDAGRYLCNAAYYRALDRAAPVLFIHIPKPPRLRRADPATSRGLGRAEWQARLADSLVAMVIGMSVEARRVVRRGPIG